MVFAMIVVVGFFGAITFGVKWFKSRGSFANLLQRIRERQVGPVGEKGNEIRPSEAGQLPSEEPGAESKPGGTSDSRRDLRPEATSRLLYRVV